MILKIFLLRFKVKFVYCYFVFIYLYVFIDINECYDGSYMCLFYVICMDIIGSYMCKCFDKGFKGDGYKCIGLGNE